MVWVEVNFDLYLYDVDVWQVHQPVPSHRGVGFYAAVIQAFTQNGSESAYVEICPTHEITESDRAVSSYPKYA
jgi:hypothetical protein